MKRLSLDDAKTDNPFHGKSFVTKAELETLRKKVDKHCHAAIYYREQQKDQIMEVKKLTNKTESTYAELIERVEA